MAKPQKKITIWCKNLHRANGSRVEIVKRAVNIELIKMHKEESRQNLFLYVVVVIVCYYMHVLLKS